MMLPTAAVPTGMARPLRALHTLRRRRLKGDISLGSGGVELGLGASATLSPPGHEGTGGLGG
eukprot:11104377-Alexandrium_andersonii.AAC.1